MHHPPQTHSHPPNATRGPAKTSSADENQNRNDTERHVKGIKTKIQTAQLEENTLTNAALNERVSVCTCREQLRPGPPG